MKINRNFIKKSDKYLIEVEQVNSYGIYDYRIGVEKEFWNYFKNGKITLSFWFACNEALDEDRYFVVHCSEAPYYQFGTIHYPAGTTEPIFCEFTINTETIPETYRLYTIFIRFMRADLGNTFYTKNIKLEVSNGHSLYNPSISELKPSKQAIFVAGGGIPRGVSSRLEEVLYVS